MIITDIESLRKQNDSAVNNEIDEIIHLLERELKASTRRGVGLSAPQIGIHKRVAIVRTEGHSVDLVNPVILERERPIIVSGEGCLSLPGMSANTCRFDEVVVKCDRNLGGLVATELEAVAIQHEVDHLNGVLMIDRAAKGGVGRNDPCPCGLKTPDGKTVKFKRCHGK
jgi:peptide deformylase